MLRGLILRLAGRFRPRHALLALCCVAFASLSVSRAAPLLFSREIRLLRMSAGPSGTRRHQVAELFAREAATNGEMIQLEPNEGTEDCLKALKEGRLDLAMISSGVIVPDSQDIKVLGAMQLEAVHLLVRPELDTGLPGGVVLRGKRVNIGKKGTTEQFLARDFLSFAHLKFTTGETPGDFVPTEFGITELTSRATAILNAQGTERERLIADLPDGLIILATTPSPLVQLLVQAADYRVLPVAATRAYIADNLQMCSPTSTCLLREYFEPASILARSYYRTGGYPDQDCETIGVRLLLVAHKDLPEAAIRPLMTSLFEGEFARRIHPKSPRDIPTSYAIHPGATAYLDRDKPLPINDFVTQVKQLFSLFGAASALALSAYGLVGRKKVRQPSDYYAEIRRIELLAQGAETESTAPIQPNELNRYLDHRLQALRQDLIKDICEGRIKGDQVITNVLALMNDVRSSLHRTELHLDSQSEPHPASRRKHMVA